MQVKIYAKVNLSLFVTGTEGQRHTLDTVVASCRDIYDLVTVEPRSDHEVRCVCPDVYRNNTAVRMCREFSSEFDTTGADIGIVKGIPVCGGLGGSSADAAAVAVALCKIFGITDRKRVTAVCDRVGSDVAYMMTGGFARLTGFGGKIDPFNADGIHAVIVKPAGGVSTAQAFALFDEFPEKYRNTNDRFISALQTGGDLSLYMKNDLYPHSKKLCEGIDVALSALERVGADARVMSGSGSACVGIFRLERDAESAARELKNEFDYVKKTLLF